MEGEEAIGRGRGGVAKGERTKGTSNSIGVASGAPEFLLSAFKAWRRIFSEEERASGSTPCRTSSSLRRLKGQFSAQRGQNETKH